MKHHKALKYFWYGVIVTFWMAIFVGVLFLPNFFNRTYNQKVLHVLTWGDVFDLSYVQQFEKDTGIAVQMSYYSSNEELYVKMYKTQGEGYDLIVPSDYMVQELRKHGFLKKLHASRMPFLKNINPLLLRQSFDPDNDYSVPFMWELYGIGFDKRVFDASKIQASWHLIFDNPHGAYKIVMTNDPVEAVMCAAQYLFGHNITKLSFEQQRSVEVLLKEQNSWVEAYSSARAGYYLATGNCPLAFATTSYILNAKRYTDYVGFVIPEEGGFITIENFAIPSISTNDDLVYQFLEFMYKPQTVVHHVKRFSNLPAILIDQNYMKYLDPEILTFLQISPDQFHHLSFFKRLMSGTELNDVWVASKT